METPVRNNLLFGIVVFILGTILLCVGIAAQPDREVHTGYVVLNNQQELDAFSTSVLLNGVHTTEYTIVGSDFPYVVSLSVVTPPNSAFTYGEVKSLSWNTTPISDRGMIGNFVLKLAGLAGIFLGTLYIICVTLWPKMASHNWRFKTEWIPYKKKDEPNV